MSKSSELFDLIHSLSKSEKRYFRILSRAFRNTSNLTRLYDQIELQQNSEETMPIESELNTNHLAVTRKLLRNTILNVLQSYHHKGSVERQIGDHLIRLEILYNKGLVQQALNEIKAAKKLAYEYEIFAPLLSFFTHEKGIAFLQNKQLKMQNIQIEEFEILNKLNSSCRYRELLTKFNAMYRKLGEPRDEEEVNDFNKIMENPLIVNEEKAITFDSKKVRLSIYYLCYTMKGDYNSAFDTVNKNIELYEDNPRQILIEPSRYLIQNVNLMFVCFRLKKFELLKQTFLKLQQPRLKTLVNTNRDTKTFSYVYSSAYLLGMINYCGKFDMAQKVVTNLNSSLIKYHQVIQKSILGRIYLQMAIGYFGFGKMKDALMIMAKIDTLLHDKITSHMSSICRLFTAILHFEIGNFDSLEYFIRSTRRFLKKQKKHYDSEKFLLDFITLLANSGIDKRRFAISVEPMKFRYFRLLENPFERKQLEYFDFVSWVECKIEEKTYWEIVHKKNANLLPKGMVNVIVRLQT